MKKVSLFLLACMFSLNSLSAQNFEPSPEVIRDVILRKYCDFRTAIAFSSVSKAWRERLSGNSNEAKLLWLHYLRQDFHERYLNATFPDRLLVADVEASAAGFNHFLRAFIDIQNQDHLVTQEEYTARLGGRLFAPTLLEQHDDLRALEVVEHERVERWEKVGMVWVGLLGGGTVLSVVGGIWVLPSSLTPGIIMVSIGGAMLTVCGFDALWGYCRRGQPVIEPFIAAAQERARNARNERGDIENQLNQFVLVPRAREQPRLVEVTEESA